MAEFQLYFPKLLKWEGREYEDVEGDSGGPTKCGVILSEWVKLGYDKDKDGDIDKFDLMLIDEKDAAKIAKGHYWGALKADQILNQSVAELIADAAYNQGMGYTPKMVQSVLNVERDGVFGKDTLKALNAFNQQQLFDRIKTARKDRYINIVHLYPKNKKFFDGWMNRLRDFNFSK